MIRYFFICLVIIHSQAVFSQESQLLKRKASFGVIPEPVENGIRISNVQENKAGTAAVLGAKDGDIVLSINGKALTNTNDLIEILSKSSAGDACEMQVLRGKKTIRLKGKFQPKPYETSGNTEVIYDQAAYKQGLLRVIISKPKSTQAQMPALLFVPGYTCSSIDNLPDYHPYKRIIDAYTNAGFVVLRIEKSGLGDSYNTPPCSSCDLLDEIENFQVGLNKLKSLPFVDTNKVFIYGHSMGGIIAPALSAKNNVAGVAVYGTTAKSWFEYQIEMYRTQTLLGGVDPLEYEEFVRSMYDICYRFFIKNEDLKIIAKDSLNKKILEEHWTYDSDKNMIFERNAEYWRQIQSYPHLENWKNTRAKVLVQFGESDFQAFSLADHKQIEWTVNHYRPGSAKLITYPLTEHNFAKSGSMQEAFNKFMEGRYQELFDEFNFQVTADAVQWSKEIVDGPKTNQEEKKSWKKLRTESYPGKQDDIYFINESSGWYVNGFGKIFQTKDGGETWEKVFEKEGTFFRTIAFLDENTGFVGTVGTDYFPNVKDTIPLYRTENGGRSWEPVAYSGPYVKGLCAIDIVKEPFINHGITDYKYHIYAVGRVGSPANMMVSHDSGKTWSSESMNEDAQMLFDIKMLDKNVGFACAASDADISKSNALILKTTNGGESWKKVYQSTRPFETTWKVSFPNEQVGYVTIQSYNPDPAVEQQRIAKTTNGGETWEEIDLVRDAGAREFGIGFIDEKTGFVGTLNSGYSTSDGGKTWSKTDLGRACNKIRIYKNNLGNYYGYAIGVDVFKGEFTN